MSKLVRFPNIREARREAAEWVARVDRGLTPEERAALTAWAASPLNKRALREMAGLWNDLSVLQRLSDLFPFESTASAAPRRTVTWRAVGIAASLALVVAVASVLLQRRPATPALATRAALPVEQIETPVGQSRTIALRDGSAVVLNTDTALSVSIGAGHRDLTLARGEAHFRVAHDASSPFRVYVNGMRVQAVGTEFGVRLREGGQVDVLVTEGTVRVESEGVGAQQARLVTANQLLSLAAGSGEVHDVAPPDLEQRLAWQRGMLVFRGEPLDAVLAEFARYTTQPLVVTDPQLRRVRVGGYFRAGDVDALLGALRGNFGIVATRDDRGRILLSAAP